jgi:tRNA (guanine37-N1)-methyltransferase
MGFQEELKGVIPDDRLLLLDHPEIIGDVALLSLPAELGDYKKEIAEAIIARRKNIKTVLNKVSKIQGDLRVPRYEILLGNDTITTYREFGHIYRFDVTKVFFNGRLGTERRRISELVIPGETVLIPFGGVGPFAIPVAARGCRVMVIEMNANACRWLAYNARLNGVEDNIDIVNGDALALPCLLRSRVDRAIVPAPYGMDQVLEVIAPRVKVGGMLHIYTFKKKYQIEGLITQYENQGLNVERYRRCGNVAPGVSRWAFDLKNG